MKRMHLFMAIWVSLLLASSSFALQGRGPGRPSIPSGPALSRTPDLSNVGSRNAGSADSHATNSHTGIDNPGADHAADAATTRDAHGFKNYGLYVAAQHVSENLDIPFEELQAKMTGPQPESLGKAIQDLTGMSKGAANAEAKKAEREAKSDNGKK